VALVCAARTGVGDDVLAGMPALPIDGLGNGPGAHPAAGQPARPAGQGGHRSDRRGESRRRAPAASVHLGAAASIVPSRIGGTFAAVKRANPMRRDRFRSPPQRRSTTASGGETVQLIIETLGR
jgi:hypothetical protein